MEKEITVAQGLALTPYSDVSPDGQLSVSHNVEVYNGSLRPSVIQGTSFTLPGELLYIHATQNYTHYLYYDDDKNVRYAIKTDDGIYIPQSSRTGLLQNLVVSHTHVSNISSVNHIGNVLVFLQPEQEVYYVIWNTNTYTDLGTIPDLKIRYSLSCKDIAFWGTKYCDFDDEHRDDDLIWQDLTFLSDDTEKSKYTEAEIKQIETNDYNIFGSLLGKIEEQYCNCENGGIIHPILLRAAWRLYDGSHIKLTPPVLLVPNTNYLSELGSTSIDNANNPFIELWAFICSIYFTTNTIKKEWGSIISGIDIYSSIPLVKYYIQPTDDIYELNKNYEIYDNTTCDISDEIILKYCKFNFTDYIKERAIYGFSTKLGISEEGYYLRKTSSTKTIPSVYTLQEKVSDDIESLEQTSTFSLLKSIDFEEITDARTEIKLKNGQYNSTSTQDKLTDEYTSRERPSATLSFSYNNRLNLANCSNTYPAGFGIEMFPDTSLYATEKESTYKLYYKIVRNNNTMYIYVDSTNFITDVYKLYYVFNPNTSAKSLIITKDDLTYSEINLKEHPLLHGNYYCNLDGEVLTFDKDIDFTPSSYEYDTDTLKNAIYTSEINNPFLFPLIGQNTVGNGEIKALSTITKALSEGQYGSFPIMAFCTDGNYSLGIATEGDNAGIISSVNPMQPDVCVNADSVTQIENGILFVSGRGVMLASANQISCISTQLDGVTDNLASSMLTSFTGRLTDESTFEATRARDFFDVIEGVVWDYISQRAIFIAKDYDIAYVFKVGTEGSTWSTINLPKYVKKIINVYPYSYIQWADNSCTILDDDYNFDASSTQTSGLLLTRPLKMETLQLKKLDSYTLQGIFTQAQKTTIWGSNDGSTWTKIGSTTRKEVPHVVGRYYKYWRIGVELSLNETENVTGMRLKFTERPENRLR